MSTAVLASTLTIAAAPVVAQGPSRAALRAGVERAHRSDTLPRPFVPSGSTGRRAMLSVVGAAAGAAGGAALALQVLPRTQCGDDPGLCEALPGLAIGSIVGAGLGAALPRGTGACEFPRLAPRAVLGAAVGYVIGAAFSGDPLAGAVLGGPIGATIGGTVGARRCRAR